jgi:serine/threonine-protein kinase
VKPWSALREVLDRAFELEGVDRDAFVASIRERDPVLHGELRRMLDRHAAIERQPSHRAIDLLLPLAEELVRDDLRFDHDRVGSDIGPYRLVQLLGAGGMGAVYLAERTSGEFSQNVALKLLRGKLVTPAAQASFERERQILAQLHHPGIATLFDGSRTAEHEAYYTMEFVDGVGIADYCDQRVLDVAARVSMLAQVAEALSYAHQNLVVHRDIKPSNVLVTHGGRTKLVDFGLAKAIESDALPTLTTFGPMTPAFAAPEQFRNEAITVATDIYQFGVLCFYVLTRSLPYRGDSSDRLTWALAVTTAEPMRLHHACEPPPGGDPGAHRAYRSALSRDLDAIVRKAIAKAPGDRYASMDALLGDLRAYLTGHPVTARRAGTLYFMKRFVQRNRLAVAATFAATLAIAAVSATAARQWLVAAQQQARAEREGLARVFAQDMLADFLRLGLASGRWGQQPSALEALDFSAKMALETPNGNPQHRAVLASVLAQSFVELGHPERALATAARMLPLVGTPELMAEELSLVTLSARAHVEAGDVAAAKPELARARHLIAALALPEPSTPALAIGMIEVRALQKEQRASEASARLRALFDAGDRPRLDQSLEFADILGASAALVYPAEARPLLERRYAIIAHRYGPQSAAALAAERALLASDAGSVRSMDIEASLAKQQETMRQAFGENSTDYADVLAFRCDYRAQMRRYVEAREDCGRVVEIREKASVRDDARIAASHDAAKRIDELIAEDPGVGKASET